MFRSDVPGRSWPQFFSSKTRSERRRRWPFPFASSQQSRVSLSTLRQPTRSSFEWLRHSWADSGKRSLSGRLRESMRCKPRFETLEDRRLLAAIEVDTFLDTVGSITIGTRDGQAETIELTGQTTVNVFFDGDELGSAIDDDKDGLDEVNTEMVELSLSGISSLGPVKVTNNREVPILGIVQEQINETPGILDVVPFTDSDFAVDSFFDLFVMIQVGEQQFFPASPIPLNATLTQIPPAPGETFVSSIPDGIELLDITGKPTEFILFDVKHTPVPPAEGVIEVDEFPGTVGQILIEIDPRPGIVTPKPSLPPAHGDYRTAAEIHAEFPNGVILQDIRHRPFLDTVVVEQVGENEIETFDSELRAMVLVDDRLVPIVLGGRVTTLVQGKRGNTTGSWQTEMVSMNLSGEVGGLSVELRESPKLPSPGQTSVQPIGPLGDGTFQIDSFFDVFVELSVDGGPFEPALDSVRVELVDSGIATPQAELPPSDGVYRSPDQIHVEFSGPELDIILEDVAHRRFAQVERQTAGADEIETFASTLTAIANIGSSGLDGVRMPVTLSGLVTTVVRGKAGATTGSWDTEMVSMSLSGSIAGGPTVLVRENPQLASSGRTTITDLGGGMFNVDSFFDVFTEISVDGGVNWTPAQSATRVELVPPRELISAIGPTKVHVFFEGDQEGDALDDDNDGLDEVVTEIVSMDLSGMSSLGPVSIGVRSDRPSLGQISEQVNQRPGTLEVAPFDESGQQADSFFDVWPVVEVGGQVFYTSESLLIETVISHKPPRDGERYVNPFDTRVELIDPASGAGTGIFIIREIHQPDPTIERDVFENTTALVQLVGGPLGPLPQAFILSGPAQANVYFEGPNEGDAFDDDGDGLDEVLSELVSMELTDGRVTLRTSSSLPSFGQIEELLNNNSGLLDVNPFAPGQATSSFDVFFEIEVAGVGVLHNRQPLLIESVIDTKPPFARYIHLIPAARPLELFDAAGNATGVFLTEAEHFTGTIEVDQFPTTLAEIELIDPNGASQFFNLTGPTTVHVFFEGNAEGDANDSDGDGLDDVQTEIVALDLSSADGTIRVGLDPRQRSLGEIEELSNNTPGLLDLPPFTPTGLADSFFDVFFEIEVGGLLLYPAQPKRLQTIIDFKPPGPGNVYQAPEVIALVDAAGNPSGYALGAIRHIPAGERAPRVDGVTVSSSTWEAPFLSHLENSSLGSEGFELAGSDDQLRTLPWNNVDKISISFDSSVDVSIDSLMILGVNVPDYTPLIVGFEHEPAIHRATWTLSEPLQNDKVLLVLGSPESAQVVGVNSGLPLDGEWPGDSPEFPSGDGVPGGVFAFRFDILAGNGTGNDITNIRDVQALRRSIGASVGSPRYSPFNDYDGSGDTDIRDLQSITENLLLRLPQRDPDLIDVLIPPQVQAKSPVNVLNVAFTEAIERRASDALFATMEGIEKSMHEYSAIHADEFGNDYRDEIVDLAIKRLTEVK